VEIPDRRVEVAPVVGVDECTGFVDVLLRHPSCALDHPRRTHCTPLHRALESS
jgi:hypothetical protein